VLSRGRVVGVLCTFDRTGWDGFEHGELPVLEAAAAVLAEALHRDELAQVLEVERAAVHASEVRWRAFARVLELVARGNAIPETLQLLARTVEAQCAARCLVVVRAQGDEVLVAAPTLPGASDAVGDALLPPGVRCPQVRCCPSTRWCRPARRRSCAGTVCRCCGRGRCPARGRRSARRAGPGLRRRRAAGDDTDLAEGAARA
jgi:hypothetical protein